MLANIRRSLPLVVMGALSVIAYPVPMRAEVVLHGASTALPACDHAKW